MVDNSQYSLTWALFEDLHHDTQNAFEKLCRFLFIKDFCDEGTILHSDPNHPGIEVEPVYSSKKGGMISFQSKYFKNRVRYEKIKESAVIAKEKYKGQLDILFLFCNIDIDKTSASYQEIATLLSDAGIELIPVTGQSVLDEVLVHSPALVHYFGITRLDEEWIKTNLDVSLKALGNRYNPRFNIDTVAESLLAIFVRSEECLKYINEKKESALLQLQNMSESLTTEDKVFLLPVVKALNDLNDITIETIDAALLWEDTIANAIPTDLPEYLNQLRQKRVSDCDLTTQNMNRYYERLSCLRTLEFFHKAVSLDTVEKSLLNNQIVVVDGKMGTGKSQLLSSMAKTLSEQGRFVILQLGQMFTGSDPVDKQIVDNFLSVPAVFTIDTLLASMEEVAYRRHTKSILFIDAINESPDKRIWETGIIRMSKLLDSYPNVRLVISVREGFEKMCIGNACLEKIAKGEMAHITHNGFADSSPEAINEFLSHYGVPFSPEIYLQDEATNPLFLTWVCQTYNGEIKNTHALIAAVIETADYEASKACGAAEPFCALKDLLNEIISFCIERKCSGISKEDILKLPVWGTYGIINKVQYLTSIERFGILTDYALNNTDVYYIGYNLLDEYLKAKRILDSSDNKECVRKSAAELLTNLDVDNESVFVMLASLYPSKFHEECIDLIDDLDEYNKGIIIDWYFASFTWRNQQVSLDEFRALANKYRATKANVWGTFIGSSTRLDSLLNAYGLHELLSGYRLNRRDCNWTTYINELTSEDRIVNLIYYLEEGKPLDGIEEARVELLLTLFGWFLSASNRPLRDRTSKAMIEVLRSRLALCGRLLYRFRDVDDPYIIQRLYGVVFGAVMKCSDITEEIIRELALRVYTEVFDKEFIYPDILLRDYARLIIERYIYEFPDGVKYFDLKKIQPPYRSVDIPKTEPGKYLKENHHTIGIAQLLSSMKINSNVKGSGLYGDFGRYVFQNAVETFSDVDVNNAYYYALDFIFNDLGYKEELFGDFDSTGHNPYMIKARYEGKKIERIGKKYQWIALYNVLARLSDRYGIRGWGLDDNSYPFTGAWEPHVRDFDPTMNVRYPVKIPKPIFDGERIDIPSLFISYDADSVVAEKWVREESAVFQNLESRMIKRDSDGKEWMILYKHDEYSRRPDEENNHMGFQKGEQRISLYVTAYLVNSDVTGDIMKQLESAEYFEKHHADIRNIYCLFNREYAWSPGYKSQLERPELYGEEDELMVHSAVINYIWEDEFDASQDTATSFMIPDGEIIKALQLQQRECDGIYYSDDEVVALDLKRFGDKNILLIKKDYLDKFLAQGYYSLVWYVWGEKQYFLGDRNQKWQERTGIFFYNNGTVCGNLHLIS